MFNVVSDGFNSSDVKYSIGNLINVIYINNDAYGVLLHQVEKKIFLCVGVHAAKEIVHPEIGHDQAQEGQQHEEVIGPGTTENGE